MNLFEILRDTQAPGVLIVAGVLFILLAVAKTVGGIDMRPERQKMSAVLGAVFLAVGMLLYVLPELAADPQEPSMPEPGPDTELRADLTDFYAPSGWMGDGELSDAETYIKFDEAFTVGCHTAPACIRIDWTPGSEQWAGIYWQHPDENWGEKPGCDLTGVRSVSFWARGEKGGESVLFEAALAGNGSKVQAGSRKLGRQWQNYEIGLEGEDVTNIVGAFAWIVRKAQNPDGATFYLDDLEFKGIGPAEVNCP